MSPKIRRPRYDEETRELRVGDVVVKKFRQRAPDQEAVLLAFEEAGWPAKIDDPLPPQKGRCPKERLQQVIKNLNRNQLVELLHFHGNGTAEAILWELRAAEKKE